MSAHRTLNSNELVQLQPLQMLLTLTAIATSLIIAQSPVALGLWVLLFALTLSATLRSFLLSWFGFLIFLIYIGGILVIFAYFSALQPNQHLKILPLSITFILTLAALMFIPTYPNMLPFNNSPKIRQILYILSWQNAPIYILLAFVLFFALVAVVKITSISRGPLRPFTPYVPTPAQISPTN